ncbi:MAG TPA: hypothetical protein VIJ18_09725 [Microbacteriaceae bacterium]
MPRSNRPRGRKLPPGHTTSQADEEELSLNHLMSGWRRTEHRRGFVWNVQPVSSAHAVKTYVCPGCELEIDPGVAHLVAWRADGVLGDASDIAARRHWHTHCWKVS